MPNLRYVASLVLGCTLHFGCTIDSEFDFSDVDDAMQSGSKADGSTDASIVMGALNKDRPVTGRFLPAAKYAAYTFEKRRGVVIRVSVDATDAGYDSVLAIYGPRTATGWGERIASNDDAPGHGTDSVIANFTLPADGKYVAIVGEATKKAGGRFEILLETSEVDLGNQAPDDSMTGAMVRIPDGEFLFGCNAALTQGYCPGQHPLITRTLPAFEIDRTEVTIGAYKKCMDAGVCTLPTLGVFLTPLSAYALYPIYNTTLADAETFCAWAGKRVPNEDEWEKAMRGTNGRLHPWGNDDVDCERAHYDEDECGRGPQPVGTRTAGRSPYGVLDGLGNVAEIAYSIDVNTPGGAVLRGGSYQEYRADTSTSTREVMPQFPHQAGIRCARTPI